jgi:mRNA interferase MazF
MDLMENFSRGCIVLVDLNPPEPAIQAGIRPCVIVSNNAHNSSRHPGVIICPVTDAHKGVKDFPGHVFIPSGIAGCKKDSVILTEQIRLINRNRIIEVTDHLPQNIIRQIDEALRFVLNI